MLTTPSVPVHVVPVVVKLKSNNVLADTVIGYVYVHPPPPINNV